MPPETAEEIAASESLDSKLAAFFEAETAADTPDAGPAAEQVEEAEQEVSTEPDVQPRDERGQFAPKDEPAAEETAETIEIEAKELLAGKFKSPQELEAAYKALESRLGSQGQELGDLRQQLEESMDEKFTRFQQSAQQNQFALNAPGLVQAAVDDGRYQEAASYALQTGNQTLYNQVMSQWAGEEPYPAYAFDNQLRQNALLQAVEQRLATVSEPLMQQTTVRGMEQAAAEFAADKPDWQQVAPEMMKVAEESQHILKLLESDDPKVRVEVLDYLYTKARGRQSDTLNAAKQTADAETQAAAREAKTQATVGTPGTKTQAKPKTEQEQWRDEFRKVLFDDSTSIRSGLTTDE